jgi:hypothetical protein
MLLKQSNNVFLFLIVIDKERYCVDEEIRYHLP